MNIEEILGNIKDGNIIFGRSNRIKSIEVNWKNLIDKNN